MKSLKYISYFDHAWYLFHNYITIALYVATTFSHGDFVVVQAIEHNTSIADES